jgi:hypothetical protein
MTQKILVIAVAAALLANVALTADGIITSRAHAQAATVRITFEGESLSDLKSVSNTAARMLDTTQNLDKLIREATLLATNSAPDAKAATETRLKLLDAILAALRRSP